jgi:ATP-dependent DNA helicase RecQ
MPSEVNYAKAGYYTEYLQHLRQEITEVANVNGIDFDWLINRLCSFSYEFNPQKTSKNFTVKKDWLQLLTVYNNLITRGLPTYPTFQVEKILLESFSTRIQIDKSTNEKTMAFRDQLSGPERGAWLDNLLKVHAWMDYRCTSIQGQQDSEEEKIFLDELSSIFGPWIFQAVECQRPFSTMDLSQYEEFGDQRVDFSIETSNTKIVIEIDGQQHLEDKQSLLDQKRDLYLKKNGWVVIRIPAWKVRETKFSEELEQIENYLRPDPILKLSKESYSKSIYEEIDNTAALFLVLTPIAIARIQWVLSWSFLRGIIDLDKPTIRIAIVEEDIPCALLAVQDFISSLEHLTSLADTKPSFPAVELEIIANKDFAAIPITVSQIPNTSSLKVHLTTLEEADTILNNHFDLVIANSIIQVGPRTPSQRLGNNNWVIINTVFSPRGAIPRFNSALPINYTCNGKNEQIKFFLQWIFRKIEFLQGQVEIIERALGNQDVIGLLPTGAGKSLCYQLSALLQPGMTLVVDPIISLMNDQIDNLKQLQIDAIAAVSSDVKFQERKLVMEKMCNRNLLMLFISPERLQIAEFREKLTNMCQHTLVPYLVIDEAHCVSEWGHDFRPAYLRLTDNAKIFCQYGENKPIVIALTGTASWDVLTDIQRELDINEDEAIITPKTFDRAELEYEVVKCNSNNKASRLISKILELPKKFECSDKKFFTNENAGIVFCPHVNGSYGIIDVAGLIRKELPDLIKNVGTFSGSAPVNSSAILWKETKVENQKNFKENRCQIMVATKAFGMGIDKSNVRFTIHYNIPTSLEAFYQEAGRAGRDKKRAICVVIFSGELSSWKNINDVSIGELDRINQAIAYSQRDDICRMLFFHNSAWKGVESELQNIMNLVNERILPSVQKLAEQGRNTIIIPFGDTEFEDNGKSNEKALYRLATLGIISDYTLDYNAKQFQVEGVNRSDESIQTALLDYFSRYKPNEYRIIVSQRVKSAKGQTILEKCIRVMLEFVYNEIEKKRRRAIFQMAEVAENSSQNLEPFRAQLLSYLEKSEFTEQLGDITKEIKPLQWLTMASKLEDIDSARHLLGGCRRALESYPDHPGLLMLLAFARLMIPKLPIEQAAIEFEVAAKKLSELSTKEEVPKTLILFLGIIKQKRPSFANIFGFILLKNFPQRDVARHTLVNVDIESEAGMLALNIMLRSVLEKTKIVNAHIIEGGLR